MRIQVGCRRSPLSTLHLGAMLALALLGSVWLPETLFDHSRTAGTGYYTNGRYWLAHMHPVFDDIGGGSWVWSRETLGGDKARSFNLNQGIPVNYEKTETGYSTRAFAVR